MLRLATSKVSSTGSASLYLTQDGDAREAQDNHARREPTVGRTGERGDRHCHRLARAPLWLAAANERSSTDENMMS